MPKPQSLKPSAISVALIAFSALVLGLQIVAWGSYKDVFHFVCEVVEEKFYLEDAHLKYWVDHCKFKATQVHFLQSKKQVLKEIHYHLLKLEASHLDVYTPVEDKLLWKGEAEDTGIRAVGVDGHIVVFKVIPGSSAARAGIRVGDECVAINGRAPVSIRQLQRQVGHYEFLRADKSITMALKPEVLTIDSGPTLFPLSSKEAILEISSFRGEYFAKKNWQKISAEFSQFERLIIDLRGNAGGNIVAMLRGLSPFLCGSQEVGFLDQPRRPNKHIRVLPDILDEMVQIKHLEIYSQVPLRTFDKSYSCYEGSVVVLIDHETASVAEVFAEAISSRPRTAVLGQVTAGDVLIAIWYDLPYLNSGHSLSVPEAIYISPSGEALESRGVWPQQELFYQMEDFRRGQDTWIRTAIGLKL